MLLKVGQNDVNSLHSRSKVTIPKEPELETAQRAQRRRYFHLSQFLLHVFYPTRDRSKQCLITWNFVFCFFFSFWIKVSGPRTIPSQAKMQNQTFMHLKHGLWTEKLVLAINKRIFFPNAHWNYKFIICDFWIKKFI